MKLYTVNAKFSDGTWKELRNVEAFLISEFIKAIDWDKIVECTVRLEDES